MRCVGFINKLLRCVCAFEQFVDLMRPVIGRSPVGMANVFGTQSSGLHLRECLSVFKYRGATQTGRGGYEVTVTRAKRTKHERLKVFYEQ